MKKTVVKETVDMRLLKPGVWSGLWSRNSNFQLQASKVFDSGSRTISPLKTKKHCIYLHNSLAPQTMSVEVETKFQAPVQAGQSYLGSPSTVLVLVHSHDRGFARNRSRWSGVDLQEINMS